VRWKSASTENKPSETPPHATIRGRGNAPVTGAPMGGNVSGTLTP
jgi:hypothetical protein